MLNDKQCRSRSAGFFRATDLDLHCLQRQGISGFSRTRVKCVFFSYVQVFIYCLELHQERRARLRSSKTGLSPAPLSVVFLLTVPWRFFFCSSSLCVCDFMCGFLICSSSLFPLMHSWWWHPGVAFQGILTYFLTCLINKLFFISRII